MSQQGFACKEVDDWAHCFQFSLNHNGLFINFSDSDENSKSTLNIPGIVISALIALMLLVIIFLIYYAQKNNVSIAQSSIKSASSIMAPSLGGSL